MKDYRKFNAMMMNAVAELVSEDSKCIQKQTVHEFMNLFDMSEKEAVLELFAANLGFDFGEYPEQRIIFKHYFEKDFKIMDPKLIEQDAYYQCVQNKDLKSGKFQLKWLSFEPYELMFIDDIQFETSGLQRIPIGCFNRFVSYPMLFEEGIEWMSIVPSEINTMRPCLDKMHGKILVLGLGLGYFVFHASEKINVESVTVIEVSKDVIELFKNEFLPHFERKEKIQVLCEDALKALETLDLNEFDCVFADIWHNGADGAEIVKQFEVIKQRNPHLCWVNWLQNSIDSLSLIDEDCM